MSRLRVTGIALGIAVSLLMWVPLLATTSAAKSSSYDVVTTQIMYRPDEPFHITDTRYPSKNDFETRTVEITRPYQNGELLNDRPVVFFVHGGGWVDGYSDWYTAIVTPVLAAEQGWVVVNVDYRLTSDQVFLAETYPLTPTKAAWYGDNVQDVADAFAWTVHNIAAYGGDEQNIFVFGHSAGGHLVSLLATHDDFRAYRPSIRGLISMSGVYDLPDLNDLLYGEVLNQTFKGGVTDTAALEEASPISYVKSNENFPPFFVLHCQLDLPGFPEQAIAFRNQLEFFGYQVDWAYLTGYDHVSEMAAIANPNEVATQTVVQYIESHVREPAFLPLTLH